MPSPRPASAATPTDVIEAMIGLGRACRELGQAAEAARHLGTAEAMAHEIANPQLLAQVTAALAETAGGAAEPLPGNLARPKCCGSSPTA